MPKTQKLLKTCTTISLILLLTGLTAALTEPDVTKTVAQGQEVHFTIQDLQGENVQLELSSEYTEDKTFSMNHKNGEYRTTLKPSNFPRKGLYRYRFISGEETFPEEGYLGLTVASLNETLENKSLNFSDTQPDVESPDYCDYKNESSDFHCEYEHFQGGMIISSAVGLYLNNSEYNREKFNNFTFGDYGDLGTRTTCEQSEDDYDCGTIDTSVEVTGGGRQGAMIYSLWESYGLTGNSSVKGLAKNYSEGSADNCDVWNGSFNCSSSRAQALMALGYWSAYERTGNETFKSFAVNLAETNYSHPLTVSAYLKAYQFTSNKSYLSEAENRTKAWLEECPNCSAEQFHSLRHALWTGYRATGEYGYYRNAINLSSYRTGGYCSWNKSSCSDPFIQGLNTLGTFQAFRAQQDASETLFNPEIKGKTVVGRNLSFDIGMRGRVESPELVYRERGSQQLWKECRIDFFDGCTIPGDNISKQTAYSYRFASEDLEFPENGSLSFAPSLVKQTFLDEAESFTTTDPESYCAPSEGDFSCDDTALQAFMIQGFASYSRLNSSERAELYLDRITKGPYVTLKGYSSLCEVKDGYMSCRYGANAASENLEGSVRQGRMINSLFSAYEEDKKGRTYQKALNYSLGAAEDCDVWNRTYEQSFECGSSLGQAEMIEGYLKAYTVTGNSTFRTVALNLTEKALSMKSSPELGSALWEASAFFNESYRNMSLNESADNISEEFTGYCIGNCSAEQYVGVNRLFYSSYLYSKDDYSMEYRNSILNTTESGCGPYKRDVSCSSPGDQGSLADLMWKSAYTMPVEIKVSDSFNLSTESVTVGEGLQSTCSVRNNLENTTLRNTRFNLATSEGLELPSGNATYPAGDLGYGNSSNVTWGLEATSAGSHNTSCSITSDSGYRDTITRSLEVQEVEQEDSGGSEGTSSSSSPSPSFGGFEPVEEKRNFTVKYSGNSQISWNRTLLEDLGVNTTYRDFSYNSSCSGSERNFYEENVNLTVNQSCQSYEQIIIDKLPENITTVNASERKGYAVKIDNATQRSVKISYRGLNQSGFSQPLVLTSSYSLPEIEFKNISSARSGNSTAFISAELNRKASCSIYRNGAEVYSANTSSLSYEASLGYGNNTYRAECGEQSFTETFTRERPEVEEPDEEMNVPVFWILGGLLLVSLGTGLYYREEIVDEAEMKLFEYRFSKFQDAVDEGDTARAIEVFESMSRDVSEEVLESDMDLMQGLLLYLLLDLVQEGKEDDYKMDVSDDLDELVMRYLKDSDGKAARLVEEKFDDVMGREVRVV